MKIKLLICLLGLLFIVSGCYREANSTLIQQKGESQTDLLQLLQQVDSLGNQGSFSDEIANDFIDKAILFANTYPEDPMSPEILYKAGIVAMTTAKAIDNREAKEQYCQKALNIFDDILKVYPEFSGVKNCIFNKGVIYDDILQEHEQAEIYYREFIARYPADSLTISIDSFLQYIAL